MAAKRKRHTDEFKAKVALEAIKGVRTTGQLSSVFGVHPTQITPWKRQLVDGATSVFGEAGEKTEEELTAPLYEQIGRLQVEVGWLKKKL